MVGFLGLTTLAGCASEAPRGSKVYYVYGSVVKEPPSDAVVINASDNRIENVTLIQRAIAEAKTNNGAALRVNESSYERVTAVLSRVPLYRNGPKTYSNRTGLYVNASGKIVRISTVESRLG